PARHRPSRAHRGPRPGGRGLRHRDGHRLARGGPRSVRTGSDMTVEVVPVEGLPEIRPGDDLPALLSEALHDLRSGDVLAVTQKIVSKAEDRIVPEAEGHDTWVTRETRRVVARRGDIVIAETRHGF